MADTATIAVPAHELPEPVTGLTTAEAAALLTGCRDRLAHGLATVFAQHIGGANEDFLGMADRATSLEQQQLYFSAMDFLDRRGQQLLQQFRSAYIAAFESIVASLRSTPSAVVMHDADELRLIDTDDFERDLAIGKLTARAACNCSQQLTALDRRFAALLRVPRISQDDNPLYPRTLFGAMLQALNDLDVHDQLALILLHEFERQTSVELPGVYADLNRYLIQAGVLPTIPLAGPLSAPRGRTPDRTCASVGGPSGWAGFEPSEDPALTEGQEGTADGGAGRADRPDEPIHAARIPSEDVFGQLARAVQMASGGWVARPTPSRPAGAPAATDNINGETSVLDLAALIDALSALQRGRADLQRIPGLRAVSVDPGQPNVLQQIRSTPMMVWSRPLDAMTIDIVAMLFDAIFNDPDLSATVRAELAKLQIPVLKVALLDKSFFSDRKHPARRLLDVIAGSGIGRNEMDEPRLVDKIREIVDTVVDRFDKDLNVFAIQTYQLEEFLRDEEERARHKTIRVGTQLEQRDRQEIAGSRVDQALAARSVSEVPVLVAAFVDRFWRRVLADIFIRYGDAHPAWNEALATMDELVWSVLPKDTAEERNRLLAALPDLLKRLRHGLESVQLQEAWDPFFDRLIRLHMAALHRETPPDSERTDPAGDASEAVPSHPAHASELGPAHALPSDSSPPDAADLALAKSLEVGTWVEFQSFRGTRKTLRLGWVSKYRGVYLFTNRQGENALTLATTSLAGHLRNGTARILSRDPLTDRAVARVFDRVLPQGAATPP